MVELINFVYSFFLGIFFSYIISFYILPKNKYIGPNSNIMKHKIFKKGKKCYNLIPEPFICPLNQKHE